MQHGRPRLCKHSATAEGGCATNAILTITKPWSPLPAKNLIRSAPWSNWSGWGSISGGSACSATSTSPSRGPDVGRDRRERLRQNRLVEDDHRAAAPGPRHGPFRRPGPGQTGRAGVDPAADSLWFPVPASGPVRQHDDRPERRLRLAAAHPQDAGGNPARGLGPAGRGGPAGEHLGQEAGRTFRRHAKTGGTGPGAGPGAGDHPLRRAHDRAGPDHERRDQRVDPQHAPPAPGHEHGGDARHANGAEGGRPRGDALSLGALAAR